MTGRAREWLVPLLLGAVVGAALWTLDPQFGPEPVDPDAPLRTPFRNVTTVEGASARVLVVAPVADEVPYTCATGGRTAEPMQVAEAVHWLVLEGEGDCAAPGLRIRRPATCPCVDEIHNVVGATFFAFDGEGGLLATNAPLGQRGDFEPASGFQEVIGRTWYLGEGAPPPGAARLPLLADAARAGLAGLPVGGVATLHVEDHPYRDLVGDVFVTARVDALVPSAP